MFKKLHKTLRPNLNNDNLDDLISLKRIPESEPLKETPTFQNFIPNFTNQADVLSMPNAKFGYNKILVVIDDHTKKFDAEPLKVETSESLIKAFEKIYARNILSYPKLLEFDNGSAFHGEMIDFCNKHNIKYRYAQTNRHRQQGLVESKNNTLARALFSFIDEKELSNLKKAEEKGKKTTKLISDWFISNDHFRAVIDFINKHSRAKVYKTQSQDDPITTKNNEILIPVGTMVRTTLDYPMNIGNRKRLYGNKFRATDTRWSREIRPIEWVSLYPGQPPLYRVQGEKVLRTKQQLQIMSLPNHYNIGFA